MTKHSATHATFVIERRLKHPPAKVFAAFSDAKAKSQWFGGPDEWSKSEFKSDFRVGGAESISGGPPGDGTHHYNGVYWDIVPNERIVIAYDMHLGDTRISVSLATTEIIADGDGTKLIYTEQGVYLDGYDDAGSREEGNGYLLDCLAAYLNGETRPALTH